MEQVLARQGKQRGRATMLHREPPSLGGLIRVCRANNSQSRNRAQAGQLLDRLVSGPVLSHADAVVRKHIKSHSAYLKRPGEWTGFM